MDRRRFPTLNDRQLPTPPIFEKSSGNWDYRLKYNVEKFNLFQYCVLARGCRPGKTIVMSEAEVRSLCLKSREIFLSQPILLELEAPLKICGNYVHAL